MQSCVAKHAPGDRLNLDYTSRTGVKQAAVTATEDPAVEIITYEKAGLEVSSQIGLFRAAWLGSKAPHLKITEPVVVW